MRIIAALLFALLFTSACHLLQETPPQVRAGRLYDDSLQPYRQDWDMRVPVKDLIISGSGIQCMAPATGGGCYAGGYLSPSCKVAFGKNDSMSSNQDDAFVLRVDASGKLAWRCDIAHTSRIDEHIIALCDAGPDGCTAVGLSEAAHWSDSLAPLQNGIFITRIDGQGKISSTKTITIEYLSTIFSVNRIGGDTLLIMAGIDWKEQGYAFALLKINLGGKLFWQKQIHSHVSEFNPGAVLPAPDGYLLAGTGIAPGNYEKSALLYALDEKGDSLWQQFLPGEVSGEVQLTRDGNDYLLSGLLEQPYGIGGSDFSVNRDLFLTKVNAQGKQLWTKTFFLQNATSPIDLKVTPNGYHLLGITGRYEHTGGIPFSMCNSGSDAYTGNVRLFSLETDKDGNLLQLKRIDSHGREPAGGLSGSNDCYYFGYLNAEKNETPDTLYVTHCLPH